MDYLNVDGYDFSLLGCPLPTKSFALSVSRDTNFIAATASASATPFFELFTDPTRPFAVARSNSFGLDAFFVSNDLFQSGQLYSLPNNYGALIQIAPTSNALAILVAGGRLLYYSNSTISLPKVSSSFVPSHIRCSESAEFEGLSNDLVVAYNGQLAHNSMLDLLYSVDGGLTYTFYSFQAFDQVYIMDVAIQLFWSNVLVLASNSKLLILNDFSQVIGGHEFASGIGKIYSAFGETYAYGSRLEYSPNGGFNFIPVAILSRDPSLPAPGLYFNETIVQVSCSPTHVALITSLARFFCCNLVSSWGLLAALPLMK